jgi:hypothetical protein
MSKIPQGEWSAIAARYAKGESISRIAQSYGCTPPAIHYILKRNKQRAPQNSEQRVNAKPDLAMTSGTSTRPTEPELPGSGRLRIEERRTGELVSGETGPAVQLPAEPGPAHEAVAALVSERSQAAYPKQPGSRASAFAAGLDRELHGRAEAAIAAFRSSFDAALEEGSPAMRQKLRQAASDLMRVAARTTIVLDRLNANAERERARIPGHLQSGYPR